MRLRSVLGQTRNLFRFARGQSSPAVGPAKVSWEVINSCDSKCRTCQRWVEETSKGLLDTREGKKLIQDAADLGTLSFSFTGGEPFLREDLLELVRFAVGRGLSTHISTNGLSFTQERVREVCESGLTTIAFSIDGPERELNDDLRGVEGYFDKVMETIQQLRGERQRTGRGPTIMINATISSANASWLPKFADLTREQGADGLTFQPVHDFGDIQLGTSKSLRLQETEVSGVQAALDRVRERDADIVPLPARFYEGMVEFTRDPASLYRVPCVAGFLFAQIDPDGVVYPCPIKFAPMGNLREQSFRDIWFGAQGDEVRSRIRRDDHPICWMNCIAPMNLLADDIRHLRLGSLARPSVRNHIRRRLRASW